MSGDDGAGSAARRGVGSPGDRSDDGPPNRRGDDGPGVGRVDAVVLAGGRGERLGGGKPAVVVAGAALLDHALDAARAATTGGGRTVVVGPPDVTRPGTLRAQEDPPFGGPVAGLAAGLAALDGAPGDPGDPRQAAATSGPAGPADDARATGWVLVLACDVPRAARAVPLLLAAARDAAPSTDGVHLVRDGRAQWLVGLYRAAALRAALGAVGTPATRPGEALHGLPVRRLAARLALAAVPDPDGVSDDVDTWDDVRRLGGTTP